MDTHIQLSQGLLTVTLQLHGFVFGFIPKEQNETQETYGGCDFQGAQVLAQALLSSTEAFVTDPASFPWHARVIWDPYSGTMSLRAAGESADLTLNTLEQRMVANFLTSGIQAFHPRPDGQTRPHEEPLPAAPGASAPGELCASALSD